MSNVLTAIDALMALTELAEHVSADLRQTAGMIRSAQEDVRDLTDAEMDQIEAARKKAVKQWSQVGDSTAS